MHCLAEAQAVAGCPRCAGRCGCGDLAEAEEAAAAVESLGLKALQEQVIVADQFLNEWSHHPSHIEAD